VTRKASTPEGKVKAQVRALLKKYGCYWHSPVQNGMGTPSLDMICCMRGLYLAVECKAPGKHLTPRQTLTKKEIEDAGGRVIVVGESVDEAGNYSGMTELEVWLLGLLS
jgi:hypothetical protein